MRGSAKRIIGRSGAVAAAVAVKEEGEEGEAETEGEGREKRNLNKVFVPTRSHRRVQEVRMDTIYISPAAFTASTRSGYNDIIGEYAYRILCARRI